MISNVSMDIYISHLCMLSGSPELGLAPHVSSSSSSSHLSSIMSLAFFPNLDYEGPNMTRANPHRIRSRVLDHHDHQ